MPRLSLRRIHRLTHRAMATVVAVSMLAMPVTYRGGADAAHAHTIFQLWEDVRIGSFIHHSAHSDHAVATEQVDREPWEPARGSPTGTSTGAVELDQDAPVASSAFTPSVRGTMLALPVAVPLLVSESFSARVRTAVRLDGITDSPTAPPPRRAA